MELAVETPAKERALWRSVAIPSEHGGWGLTLEPVLLGLIVAWSWPGLAVGLAAFLAFLVRTPLKLAVIDRRRGRSLPRTRLATRIAAIELLLIAILGLTALRGAGAGWLWPVIAAVPLVAVELWFDVRSRGRRLIPELAGSIGICAVVAAVTVAGDGGWKLGVALWLVLAGRAVASIPYVRTQIMRMRKGSAPLAATDAFNVSGFAIAAAGLVLDTRVWLGVAVVAAIAVTHSVAMRRAHIPPPKTIGFRQMGSGLAVVAACAIGVLI